VIRWIGDSVHLATAHRASACSGWHSTCDPGQPPTTPPCAHSIHQARRLCLPYVIGSLRRYALSVSHPPIWGSCSTLQPAPLYTKSAHRLSVFICARSSQEAPAFPLVNLVTTSVKGRFLQHSSWQRAAAGDPAIHEGMLTSTMTARPSQEIKSCDREPRFFAGCVPKAGGGVALVGGARDADDGADVVGPFGIGGGGVWVEHLDHAGFIT